jgi:hypothetical protein
MTIDFKKIFSILSPGERRRMHGIPRPVRKDDDYDIVMTGEDLDDNNDNNNSGGGSPGGKHLEHLADLVVAANPTPLDRGVALNWLLHDRDGRALFARTMKRKEQKVQPESFERMLKDMGIERIAAAVVKRGHSSAISEQEYTDAMTDLAVKRYPDKPRDVAFSKLWDEQSPSSATLRRAYSIIRKFPMLAVVEKAKATIMPLAVGNISVDDPEEALDDEAALVAAARRKFPYLSMSEARALIRAKVPKGKRASAYDELTAKAERLREQDDTLSASAAFAKVYEDPANAHLAQAERLQNRPRA